jgi:hypothetical protein
MSGFEGHPSRSMQQAYVDTAAHLLGDARSRDALVIMDLEGKDSEEMILEMERRHLAALYRPRHGV